MRVASKPSVITGSVYDQGERVRVNGLDTWVVRAGPRGGTPVVFLHGIPTSAYLYRDVIQALHEEHDCVAFDWPGFGSSSAPKDGDLTHRARADHLRGVLDTLGIERAHLVVHDVGGPAGLLFAVEHPARVEKLVILNTTVYKRDYRPPVPAVAQFVPLLRAASRPFFTQQTFELFFKQGLGRPKRASRLVLDNHWRLAKSDGGKEHILDTWAQFAQGAEAIRAIREKLASFDRPTLVLFGAEDPFLPTSIAERFVKEMPNAELQLLAGAGHFLQEDAPEEVAERLAAFLAT